jgi:hypothetical protein
MLECVARSIAADSAFAAECRRVVELDSSPLSCTRAGSQLYVYDTVYLWLAITIVPSSSQKTTLEIDPKYPSALFYLALVSEEMGNHLGVS